MIITGCYKYNNILLRRFSALRCYCKFSRIAKTSFYFDSACGLYATCHEKISLKERNAFQTETAKRNKVGMNNFKFCNFELLT